MSKAMAGAGEAAPPSAYPGRGVVLLTGVLSLLSSLALSLPCVLLLVNIHLWQGLNRAVQRWLESNHWDTKVITAPSSSPSASSR